MGISRVQINLRSFLLIIPILVIFVCWQKGHISMEHPRMILDRMVMGFHTLNIVKEDHMGSYKWLSPDMGNSSEEPIRGGTKPKRMFTITKHDLMKLTRKCETEIKSTSVRFFSQQHQLCPCFTSKNEGVLNLDLHPPSWQSMAHKYTSILDGVEKGGYHKPNACNPRQRVAIVIPYRDRERHLQVLINHIHNVLLTQNMEYQVFVVEQAYPNIFNRAALINIGYIEGSKLFDFDCIIIHDVDLLLEDDRSLYACYSQPRHMSNAIDKYNYKQGAYGGVWALSREQFRLINGYPTRYWGWGSEDIDAAKRMKHVGLKPVRQNVSVERFTMMGHGHDVSNPRMDYRSIGKTVRGRYADFQTYMDSEGLSSVDYKVYIIYKRPLFTWIYAEPLSVISKFNVLNGTCENSSVKSTSDVSLIVCAEMCDSDENCPQFSMWFDSNKMKSKCSIHSHECTVSNASIRSSNEYLYKKGRNYD